jgi:hypothetical protein
VTSGHPDDDVTTGHSDPAALELAALDLDALLDVLAEAARNALTAVLAAEDEGLRRVLEALGLPVTD